MADTSQGSGTPTDAGTGGQAPQGTQPPATPPAQQQPTGQAPDTQQPEGKPSMTLEKAQQVIDELRNENAKHRTTNKSVTQQRDAILKALGLTTDGTDAPPDPEALAAQVTEQQAINWETAAENAILRVAPAAGADADALLDSNAFLDSLGDLIALDPKSAEFRTKLQAHITVWVDKHPKHKTAAAGTATRSGGDHPGGGGTPTTRPRSLQAAVSKALGSR